MYIINLFGGPGSGKCFLKGTKVIMHDGTIKCVEDVVVGDELMGPDGKNRNVLSLSHGKDMLYEVKPTKGKSHYVTGNHVLPLKLNHHGSETDYACSVREFSSLSKWKQERLKLYRAGHINFKDKIVPIDPYFIGCWLGDGNNANQGITTADAEIITYLEGLAKNFDMRINKVGKIGTTAVRIDITNGRCSRKPNRILNILRDLNLIHNKHIPNIYKINSIESRLKLLAGLIDTDGSLRNGTFEIVTKYKTLSSDIQFLCRSLGLAIYEKEKYINGSIYYRLIISGDLDKVPTLLKRKKAEKRKQIKNVLRTGLEIKQHKEDEYYGFEVDKDHLFILEDFTVTHNSTSASGLFSLLKLHGVDAELVTEYAKDLVWEERSKTFDNQIYIFGKQHHRMWRLKDKVDVVITDSPLFLSIIYNKAKSENFDKVILDSTYNLGDNLNFFLTRIKKYNPNGRNQTEEEAGAIDTEIKDHLSKYGVEYSIIDGNYSGINKIAELILNKLGKDIEFFVGRK